MSGPKRQSAARSASSVSLSVANFVVGLRIMSGRRRKAKQIDADRADNEISRIDVTATVQSKMKTALPQTWRELLRLAFYLKFKSDASGTEASAIGIKRRSD
jgi:hypothetical protein